LSSILKALKKLESQAKDQNHVRIWRPKNHVQNDSHDQIKGHPYFKKGYVIIIAGLVLAVGAGLILSKKRYENKPELITKKEAILEKPARSFERKAVIPDKKTIPQKPDRLPGKKVVGPDKKVMPQQSVRLPEKKTAIPDNAQKEMAPRKHVKKSEPITKVARAAPTSAHESRGNNRVLYNKKTSPLKQTRKKTVVEKTSEKSVQNTEDDRFSSFPVKRSNQTKIEVQAIAWSNDPKSRLAVINGLILREGESIDNIIVMHIGKDAVVFRKGAEGWKQMFGF
jgi:hypothetical protein